MISYTTFSFHWERKLSEYHAFLIGATVLLFRSLHGLAAPAIRSAITGFLDGVTDRARLFHLVVLIIGRAEHFIHVVSARLVYSRVLGFLLIKIARQLWIVRIASIGKFTFRTTALLPLKYQDFVLLHAVSHLDKRDAVFYAFLVSPVHGVCIGVGS